MPKHLENQVFGTRVPEIGSAARRLLVHGFDRVGENRTGRFVTESVVNIPIEG